MVGSVYGQICNNTFANRQPIGIAKIAFYLCVILKTNSRLTIMKRKCYVLFFKLGPVANGHVA